MNRGSPTAALRPSRRREETLERVLDGAAQLFLRRGFFETSMADIASEAGVAVGTLYNLFENKEELYRTLTHTKALLFHSRISAALQGDASPQEKLERYIRGMIVMFEEQAPELKLYVGVLADARFSFSTTLRPETLAVFEDGHSILADIVAQGIRAGMFRIVDPYRAAVALQAVTLEYLFLNLDDPDRHPVHAVVEDLRSLIIGGLTAGADGSHQSGRVVPVRPPRARAAIGAKVATSRRSERSERKPGGPGSEGS